MQVVLVLRARVGASAGAARVATATTRAPSREEAVEHAAPPSAGTSTQRASTASGAPFVTSTAAPPGAVDDDRHELPLVVEGQDAERAR